MTFTNVRNRDHWQGRLRRLKKKISDKSLSLTSLFLSSPLKWIRDPSSPLQVSDTYTGIWKLSNKASTYYVGKQIEINWLNIEEQILSNVMFALAFKVTKIEVVEGGHDDI